MARFHGKVGYSESQEVPPNSGIWKDLIVAAPLYFGDVIRNTRKLENGEGLNDNVTVSNSISIVADAYANDHFFAIRYVEWAGTLWKVTQVEVKRPRLILTLGSVYNGPTYVPPPDPPVDPGD